MSFLFFFGGGGTVIVYKYSKSLVSMRSWFTVRSHRCSFNACFYTLRPHCSLTPGSACVIYRFVLMISSFWVSVKTRGVLLCV